MLLKIYKPYEDNIHTLLYRLAMSENKIFSMNHVL